MNDYDNLVIERNKNRFIRWGIFGIWKYCKKGEKNESDCMHEIWTARGPSAERS